MGDGFDLGDLAEVARDRSPEGRSAMFAMLVRLFWRRGAVMRPKERLMLAEILRLLRPRTLPEKRLELAYEISGSTLAEPELLRVFAEDEIDIASPVLFATNRLDPSDFVSIIEVQGGAHAATIATRKALDGAVVDALARLEDPGILRHLLANQDAPFSIPALSAAAEAARADTGLQAQLAARHELPEALGEEMLEWVDPEVREMLSSRFLFDARPAAPGRAVYGQNAVPLVQDAAEGTAPADAAILDPGPIELNAAAMISSLRAGDLALFQAQFAHLARLRIGLVRRLMGENGGESVALIARAINLRREEFAQVYLHARKLMTRAKGVGTADLGQALDFFDRTDMAQAGVIVARWRRESAREPIEEPDGPPEPPLPADPAEATRS